MSGRPVEKIVEEIFELYEKHGGEEYAGEKVSQLEHMGQAAQLAIKEGFDDEVILAAFLHDIGHLLPVHNENESMNSYGMMDHERVGAGYLMRLGFSERLCKLVASHVAAKRYLTFKDPGYYERLSEASKRTLEYQGGRMDATAAAAFEADELFELYIKMRFWDEAAKIEGLPLPDLALFRQMTYNHLMKQAQ
jgi:phosphonate degradation associated HDIG domain protein